MRGAAKFVNEIFKHSIVAAQVGVERGLNATEMLQSMNFDKLYLIDDYAPYTDYLGGFCPQEIQDQVYQWMFKNLSPYLDKVVFITKSSMLASTLFQDEFFDFIYIDGNHNYDNVKQDMSLWYPKVKKGGILSGHDFDPRNVTRQDVAEAVKDFCKENKLEYKVFPYEQINYSDWVIVK